MLVELNIDALVGPTHHFGGVGVGNIASTQHARHTSHPRRAALEGLDKAAYVASLGIPQFVLPPLPRPHRALLAQLGFEGDLSEQCRAAQTSAPLAYSATFSSAFMWAANSATYSPAADCRDGRNHLTLANLCSSWHRHPESWQRKPALQEMFASIVSHTASKTQIHEPLPPVTPLRDEGAANHMRLCDVSGEVGLHVFVYGERDGATRPQRHLPRHTLAASQAIARLHQLDPQHTFFLQQHPDAIDAGVFHNDVIATSHRDMLLHHELAFIDADAELQRLEQAYARACGRPLKRICIAKADLPLADAVESYLFNSQLISPPRRQTSVGTDVPEMLLLCAAQCSRMPHVRAIIDRWIADDDNPIEAAHFVPLDESMAGGGGPACLRLRIQLPDPVIGHFASRYRLTPLREAALRNAIERYYPEQLHWEELANVENLEQFALAHSAIATAL